MGWLGRMVHRVKSFMGLEPRVIHRSQWPERRGPVKREDPRRTGPLPPKPSPFPSRHGRKGDICPATHDEASVTVGRLTMAIRSSSHLDVPYELTVVVPRVEITERYVDGRLAEVTSTYSSVTIARSPRFEGSQGSR